MTGLTHIWSDDVKNDGDLDGGSRVLGDGSVTLAVDLMFESADLNLKVPDLRSGEIRLTLTHAATAVL